MSWPKTRSVPDALGACRLGQQVRREELALEQRGVEAGRAAGGAVAVDRTGSPPRARRRCSRPRRPARRAGCRSPADRAPACPRGSRAKSSSSPVRSTARASSSGAQPEREVEAAGATSSRRKRPRERPSTRADQLADEVAVEERRLAVRLAGRPLGLLRARAARTARPSRRRPRSAPARRAPRCPAWCESTWRTVAGAMNSGQYACIGASSSSAPRSTSRSAQTAANGLVTEYGCTMLSRSHGRVRAASAQPPQRSTTQAPSRQAATAAPVPPRAPPPPRTRPGPGRSEDRSSRSPSRRHYPRG